MLGKKNKTKHNSLSQKSNPSGQNMGHISVNCAPCFPFPSRGSVTENGLWNDQVQQHKSTTKIRLEHVKSSWGQSQAFRKQHESKTSLGRALIHLVTRVQRVHADNGWCIRIHTGSRTGIQALHRALTAPL